MGKKTASVVLKNKEKSTSCKCCNSDSLDSINIFIKDGKSNEDVILHLNLKGTGITPKSLQYHRKNHYPKQIKLLTKTIKQKQKKKTNAKISKAKQDIHNKELAQEKVKDPEILDTSKTSKLTTNTDDGLLDKETLAKRKKYINQIKRNTKDFDLITEMVFTLKVQKDRMFRSIEAEELAGVPLIITGKAISDYQKSLGQVHEITKGMDSLKELRLAEIAQSMVSIMSRHQLSDRTRFELFTLVKSFESTINLSETFEATDEEIEKYEQEYTLDQLKEEIRTGKIQLQDILNLRDKKVIVPPSESTEKKSVKKSKKTSKKKIKKKTSSVKKITKKTSKKVKKSSKKKEKP